MPLTLFGAATAKTATGTATTTTGYVRNIILNNDGYDYTTVPTVAISTSPTGNNATAVAITTSVNNIYSVKEILLTNTSNILKLKLSSKFRVRIIFKFSIHLLKA